MRADPVRQCLAPGGFGVSVIGRAHHRHEDLCLVDISGGAVNDGHGLAGIVHEQLLSGPMVLAHHQVQLAPPDAVVLAEPAVLITVGGGLPVLLPEQEQGDILAREFVADVLPVGMHRACVGRSGGCENSSCSRWTSSRSAGNGQLRPASTVRRRYSLTVGRLTPQAAAISRLLSSRSHLRRRTSLILRTDNLFAGIWPISG